MPAGHGLRSRTRDLFARPFRKKGYIPLTTYLRSFKIGEYVDVKVNGAIHKGMPHKFYHGRTGRVWNVTKRAIGVEINKQVAFFFFFFLDCVAEMFDDLLVCYFYVLLSGLCRNGGLDFWVLWFWLIGNISVLIF
jgi:large subunit ribosomal protein L21e